MITIAALGSLAILFAASFASAVVPFSPPEAFVLALTATGSHSPIWALTVAAVAAAGQGAGKAIVVGLVRGSVRRPPRFVNRLLPRRLMDRMARHIENHPRQIGGLVALSAFASIPPLVLVAPLVGATGMRPRIFLVFCFIGRLSRFGVLALAPSVLF